MVMDNLKEIMTMLFVEQPGYTMTINHLIGLEVRAIIGVLPNVLIWQKKGR